MSTHQLGSIFKPRRIALIGVTANPRSVGGKIISNLVGNGFQGVIYPVSATLEAVQGMACYANLTQLPHVPDLAMICTAAEQVPEAVRACGEAGIKGVIIVSAGFKETGEAGQALEQAVREAQQQFKGMRILGPNCLGIIAPGQHLNASFGPGMPRKGHVAFISQSGALCTSVLDWAIQEKIGFSYFVSVGNALDVDFGDLIDYFGEDEETEAIILYVESIARARAFLSAARAFARSKPIIVYKAGRFPQSAAVAASHTGAMAAEDAVYEAAFQRAGLVRIYNIDDVFHTAELIGRQKLARGPRLGIVTNAGGPGVMAVDALIDAKGTLAALSDETMANLDESLPPMWSHGNPVDVLGDAPGKRLAKAVRHVVDDSGVDAVLVILTPQAMTNATASAKALIKIAAETRKPILAAWMGGERMAQGIRLLTDANIPTYMTPEQGVRAFMVLVEYARNLESLYQTPKDIPVEFTLDRKTLRDEFETLIPTTGDLLDEAHSKIMLEAYGIPTARPRAAASAEDAVKQAEAMGFPVVLKILSPEITHKTDVGGVVLNLGSAAAVREAFITITDSARRLCPKARIDGVTVQPFIETQHGVELILGTKKDPVFGTVIMAGAGGVTAELYNDSVIGLPPLTEKLARRMLQSLKIWPLLEGYRGSPTLHIDRLIEILIRLSYLAADYPEIGELDINPLLVTAEDVIALDARVVLDRKAMGQAAKPFAHLALRPYPEEFVRPATLQNGTPILLRPIKPEDEPLWFDLLGDCSKESLYMRFRYAFHWHTHEVATRYCFNDYDREIAIVAEQENGGKRRLIGVGRLIADPDRETAEFAILIADYWQNHGLGGVITDFCMQIAREWGLKKIFAQTTTDNPRMISVFRKRGFEVQTDLASSMVEVSCSL